ncbi:ABC transporter substrate-binding protein [Xanthobacter sp.]|uniref:ABC transporter substrate-binding protein n=1 Tax=Xanthobacter sp. TaxID=35809 RepID=UPI0035B1F992
MTIKRLILALAVTLSGLGGAAQAADKPVKIGVLTDMSGIYSDFGGPGSVLAARMAAEDFGGKVGGAPVEIVAADHQNKADVGSSIARRWFDQDGVEAIADVPTSSVALAVAEIAREKNKVLLVSGAGTSDITGKNCSPNTVHWTYDTWALANSTGGALTKAGYDTWFFITVDYSFGYALERDASDSLTAAGGKILGKVRHPVGTSDFSSFLVQAQASQAKVVAFGNAGADTINGVKQAAEFGLVQGGQKLASMLITLSDIHALGLKAAQGLVLTEAFYWDLNDGTRDFGRRFAARNNGVYPNMVHAGVYGAVMHYLKARASAGTDDGKAVVEKMKATKTDDPLFGVGEIRADGRKIHDLYLFEVKAPGESKGTYDLYKLLRTVPAAEAFRPLASGGCNLVH